MNMRNTIQKTILTLSVLALPFLAVEAHAEEHIVKIVSDYENMRMVFEPKSIHIEPGDTVTWINQADETHNVITYPDGYPDGADGFQSPFLEKKDDKFSHTFIVGGTYEYHCIPHLMMGMHGNVVVGKSMTRTDFHQPTAAENKAYRDQLLEFFDEDDIQHMPAYVRDHLMKK